MDGASTLYFRLTTGGLKYAYRLVQPAEAGEGLPFRERESRDRAFGSGIRSAVDQLVDYRQRLAVSAACDQKLGLGIPRQSLAHRLHRDGGAECVREERVSLVKLHAKDISRS